MDAPKCKSCGKQHWERVCPSFKRPSGPGHNKVRAPVRTPEDSHSGQPHNEGAGTSSRGGLSVKASRATSAGADRPAREKPKVGRPRIEDRAKTLAALKPWMAAQMSRSSWYRRQAEKRKP